MSVLSIVLAAAAQMAAASGLAVTPAAADVWSRCRNDDTVACTALIAAGDESGSALAEAHYHRGNARRLEAQRARSTGHSAPGPDTRSEFDPALADYDAAIRLRPDFAEAYVNRGVVRYDKGDYDGAIADNDAAIRLQSDLAEAYNNRSLAWYKKGDMIRAQRDFDRTIRLKQNYGNAMIMRPMGSSAEPRG